MKTTRVEVRWLHGLHARQAARLVWLAHRFHSQIHLRLGARLADAKSILHILILSAGPGTALQVDVDGVDEHEAIQAVEKFFQDDDSATESESYAAPLRP
jgi:phosphotransferase system HPr (HPr) family protein